MNINKGGFFMKRKFFIIILAISLVMTAACSQHKQKKIALAGVESSISQMGDIERVQIMNNNANINAGCSNNTPTIYSTNKNDTFNVLSKVADWYAVKLPDNRIGFVPTSQCKPIIANDKPTNLTPAASSGAPQGTTAPKTPTTQANSTTLTTNEQQMITLVNQARVQNHVAVLKVDMQLTNVARVKAQDMIDNKYFSHNSPKYGSPFDMMKNFGVKYIKAGENIAGNQSVQNAFNALMNSPGHRKNILDPSFTNIGIGIKSGGPYGNMFSQMFISK
jgi:uncharacterized YkwD family protein